MGKTVDKVNGFNFTINLLNVKIFICKKCLTQAKCTLKYK